MRNVPAILYTLAAVIWLLLGFLSWNVVYLCLAAVFFVLAIRKRKGRSEE